ncbi:MAG: gamma-glutamyl-gamma-aminobutyrate hydrolase family protein [Thermoguttaceae bacterium]|nr:gamma-glutamyl-gamma-aminobutyrate hydrolase family protein [Thermoguttaceae bacterium]
MAGQKPIIAINADYKTGKSPYPSTSYLFTGYFEAVIKAGGVPIILPPYQNEQDIDQVLDMVDGVIMVGGADIDPRRDGYMLHPSIHLMSPVRETFDRALIKKVYERRIPFYGIGAGMQLLNVTLGGTLFLHIAEDIASALPHRDAHDPYHRHALVVEPGSLLDRVYGDNAILVNSMHHMAVDDVADGFLATGKCPDSVIEAIEYIRDDWFAFGTQFHPEAVSATVLDLRIFGEFIAGVVRCSKKQLDLCFADESVQPVTKAPNKPVKERNRKKAAELFPDSAAKSPAPKRAAKKARSLSAR